MEAYASAIILLVCAFAEIVSTKSFLNIVNEPNTDVAAAISLKARIKNRKSHNDVNVSFNTLIDVQDLHRIIDILVNSPYYVNDQANKENAGIVRDGISRYLPHADNPLENAIESGTDTITAAGKGLTNFLKMVAEPFLGSGNTGGPRPAQSISSPTSMSKCDYVVQYLLEAYPEVGSMVESYMNSRKRIDGIDHKTEQMEEEDGNLQQKIDSTTDLGKRWHKHQMDDKIAKKQLSSYHLDDDIDDYDNTEEDINDTIASHMREIESFDHGDWESEDLSLQEKIYESIKEMRREIHKMQSEKYNTGKKRRISRNFNDEINDDYQNEMEDENINLDNNAGIIKNCTVVPIDSYRSASMQGNNSVGNNKLITKEPTRKMDPIRRSEVTIGDDHESDFELENGPSLKHRIHEDREEHLHGIARNGTSESNAAKEREMKKPLKKLSPGNLKVVKKRVVYRQGQVEGTLARSAWNKSGAVISYKDIDGKNSSKIDEKPISENSSNTDKQTNHGGARKITINKLSNEDGSTGTHKQTGHVMGELVRAIQTGIRPRLL